MLGGKEIDVNYFFSPSSSLRKDNSRHFVGRSAEFKNAIDGLAVRGSTLFVHADRGLGKTSFAWQMADAIKRQNLRGTPFGKQMPTFRLPKLKPLWLQCRSDMHDMYSVLAALLVPGVSFDSTIRDGFPELFTGKTEIESIERTSKLSGGFFDVQTKVKKTLQSADAAPAEIRELQSIAKQLFLEKVAEARKLSGDKDLLIILDEFDQLEDKTGFGSLVKECSDARFAFVGITEDVSGVIEDHFSVGRKGFGAEVELGRLEVRDVSDLFEEASTIGEEQNISLRFSQEFVQQVNEFADGTPSLVQYIGLETIRHLDESGGWKSPRVANSAIFHIVLKKLFGPKRQRAIYKNLQNLVRGNANRLAILQILSLASNPWVDESDLIEELDSSEAEG
ncbi:MAG: hypothetical protein AAGM22_24660, partial [Acidobacteriota bacterium]